MLKLCGRGFAFFTRVPARSLFMFLVLVGLGPMAGVIAHAQDTDRGANASVRGGDGLA